MKLLGQTRIRFSACMISIRRKIWISPLASIGTLFDGVSNLLWITGKNKIDVHGPPNVITDEVADEVRWSLRRREAQCRNCWDCRATQRVHDIVASNLKELRAPRSPSQTMGQEVISTSKLERTQLHMCRVEKVDCGLLFKFVLRLVFESRKSS